jgi:hypothetical protein
MPVHHHPKRSWPAIRQLAQELAELSAAEIVVPEEGRVYQLD